MPEQAVLFGNCERTPVKLKPDLYVGIPRAASYAFQISKISRCGDEDPEVTLSSTAIIKYVGIEKRDGLVSTGKRLLKGAQISSSYYAFAYLQLDIPHDSLNIAWQRKFHHDSFAQTRDGSSTIAISAFFLSTLRTSLQRKSLVKEMWESGADTIVSSLIIVDLHHL